MPFESWPSMLLKALCVLHTAKPFYILMIPTVFTTAVFCCFLLRQLKWKNGRKRETLNLPPGPTRLPLVGNMLLLLGASVWHRSFDKLSKMYGPLMFLQLGTVPTLVVSSADVAKQIFGTHDIVFSGRSTSYASKKLTYGCSDITFSPYGEYWREVRKIAMLELLSVKRVQSFQAAREEEVAKVIRSISKDASFSVPINLSEVILSLVNDVVCRVAFGKKYGDGGPNKQNCELRTILLETQELLSGFSIADFFPWMSWIHKFDGLEAKLVKNFRELDDFYNNVIEEHLNPDRPNRELENLVDVLLRVQKDPSQTITLSRDQIKGILTDIFIAGTDPASGTLVWTMTELVRNPITMKRAKDELRMLVGEKDFVHESDLPGLKYLKATIKESMRLHSPAPLPAPRETTDNCVVNGYDIPAKTRVFVNVTSIAMDPKHWEDPEEFRPERFLHGHIDQVIKGVDFNFIPFGAGRRGCPGIHFAMLLMELVLANLLHSFDWELPREMNIDDVDMKEAPGLTMHKKFPLCLAATEVSKCDKKWSNDHSIH